MPPDPRDALPIYGDRAMDGSHLTATQLDTCNGITSATPNSPTAFTITYCWTLSTVGH